MGRKITNWVVKDILDYITEGATIDFKWKEVIGGKKFTVAYIGYKYKLIFSGAKGSVLHNFNNNGNYELLPISHSNFMFLIGLCRLYKDVISNYTISKKQQ